MSECLKYQELISAYADGIITEAEEKELLAHIDSCPDCRALLDIYKCMHSSYTNENMEEPPKELLTGVMSAIGASPVTTASSAAVTKPNKAKSKNTKKMIIALTTMAACLVLAVLAFPLMWQTGKSDAAADVAMDAADAPTADYAADMPADAPAADYDDSEFIEETEDDAVADVPSDDAADTPVDDTVTDNTQSDSKTSLFATAYIYGELPDFLSADSFTDNGDGTLSYYADISLIGDIEAFCGEISYTGASEEESSSVLIVWTP